MSSLSTSSVGTTHSGSPLSPAWSQLQAALQQGNHKAAAPLLEQMAKEGLSFLSPLLRGDDFTLIMTLTSKAGYHICSFPAPVEELVRTLALAAKAGLAQVAPSPGDSKRPIETKCPAVPDPVDTKRPAETKETTLQRQLSQLSLAELRATIAHAQTLAERLESKQKHDGLLRDLNGAGGPELLAKRLATEQALQTTLQALMDRALELELSRAAYMVLSYGLERDAMKQWRNRRFLPGLAAISGGILYAPRGPDQDFVNAAFLQAMNHGAYELAQQFLKEGADRSLIKYWVYVPGSPDYDRRTIGLAAELEAPAEQLRRAGYPI